MRAHNHSRCSPSQAILGSALRTTRVRTSPLPTPHIGGFGQSERFIFFERLDPRLVSHLSSPRDLVVTLSFAELAHLAGIHFGPHWDYPLLGADKSGGLRRHQLPLAVLFREHCQKTNSDLLNLSMFIFPAGVYET